MRGWPVLGAGRLLTFAFRALVLLVLIPLLWTIAVVEPYNDALSALARFLLPDDLTLRAVGSHILLVHPRFTPSVSIDALMLHFGPILLGVLVLAAVGLGFVERVRWLLAMGAGAFVLHVVALALLARGLLWASGETSFGSAETLVLSVFAVFWGLLPPIIGGAWCFLWWLPRTSGRSPEVPANQTSSNSGPG